MIVGLICGSYLYILSDSRSVDIALKTVYGSEEVLKDIAVKGDIGDFYHKVSFTLQNGSVKEDFSYISADKGKAYDGNASTMSNIESVPKYIHFCNTGHTLILQTETAEYYISGFDIYTSAVKNEESEEFEAVQEQVVYTVAKKDSSDEIKYMGKVGEKLIVIILRSGYLYADIIDPAQKKLLGEMEIGEYRAAEIFQYSDPYSVNFYDSAESNGYFILRQLEHYGSKPYFRFYVIDINNFKVVENVRFRKQDYNIVSYYTKVLYKNGIFYVLYQCQQEDYRIGNINYISSVTIYAYQGDKKLYEGNLISDISNSELYDRKIYNAPVRSYYNMRME